MRPFLIYSLLIVAATLAVYWPVGGHEIVNFDDPVYVVQNPHVLAGLTWDGLRWAFTSATTGNWHPLTWLSLMIDVELFGYRFPAYHWTSLALHIIATLLLLAFLGRTTRAWGVSAIVSFIFALHPLHVESVAWLSERKDVLCGAFFFLTLNLYARYASRKNPYAYAATLLAFIGALLSKPMAVTLPCVLLLLDVWPLRRLPVDDADSPRRFRNVSPLIIEKLPFLASSIAVSAMTLVMQDRVESVRDLEQARLGLRAANALVAYVAYLFKTVYPVDLAVYYPYPADGIPWWKVTGSALVLILLTLGALAMARKSPCLPVGWFWFLGMLVPVIGLVQVGSQAMADRYMYLPMAGLLMASVWWIAGTWSRRRLSRALGIVLAVSACFTLGMQSREQVTYWQNSVALFEHALNVAPDSALVRGNLGAALLARGDLDKAREHLERAIQLRPNDVNARNNLGVVFLRMGERDAAITQLSTALQLEPNNAEVHFNLGLALKAAGQLDAARFHFATAVGLNPTHVNAHFELGDVLLTMGNGAQAALHYREVLRLRPERASAWLNTGIALASVGQFEDAVTYLEHGLTLWPSDQHGSYYLAKVRVALGQTDFAIQVLEKQQGSKSGLSLEAQVLLRELKRQAGIPE